MSEYRWTSERSSDQPIADGYEILLRPDGSEVTCITEPEDRVSYRDLKPVTAELNALAKRVEELETLLSEWWKRKFADSRPLLAIETEAKAIATRRAGRAS